MTGGEPAVAILAAIAIAAVVVAILWRVERRSRELLAGRDSAMMLLQQQVEFRLVGKHLGNASNAFGAADRRFDKLADRLATIDVAQSPEGIPMRDEVDKTGS